MRDQPNRYQAPYKSPRRIPEPPPPVRSSPEPSEVITGFGNGGFSEL